MTRLQSVTPKLPEVGKIQSTLPMMWVSGKRLSGRRLLKPTSVSRLLMNSLDGTGCLEGVLTFSVEVHHSVCPADDSRLRINRCVIR
ncbi:hypothetical protein TNCV_1338651 [Trichonephila clavipes]|nr:hypothetical protein TNCV_1338651 [Trichonephila clavipes]